MGDETEILIGIRESRVILDRAKEALEDDDIEVAHGAAKRLEERTAELVALAGEESDE